MSQYLRSIVYKGTFDGDEVEVVLRPLQFKDAIKFQGKSGTEVGALITDLLVDYVQEVRGLKTADGSSVTREELLGSSYFAPLLINVGLELVQRASVANP